MEPVIKNAKGQVGTRYYDYADLGNVIDTVLPTLRSCNIFVLQAPGGTPEGAQVETRFIHMTSGQWVSATAFAPCKNDPQGVGSAITYLRRYALVSMLTIAPEDDDGERGSAETKPRSRKAQREAPYRQPDPEQEEGFAEDRVPAHEIKALAAAAKIPNVREWLRDTVAPKLDEQKGVLTPAQSREAKAKLVAMNGKMTMAQRGKLNAMMNKNGLTGDTRHDVFGRLTGKRSSDEFNKADANKVIDWLKETYGED